MGKEVLLGTLNARLAENPEILVNKKMCTE
jgi:hypothetical protein